MLRYAMGTASLLGAKYRPSFVDALPPGSSRRVSATIVFSDTITRVHAEQLP